jgi:hypothetical protein
MAKTFDEKRSDFDRMLEGRLPKAVKAVELLANLARKSDYAWTPAGLQTMLDQLDDAVDAVAKAFGASEGQAPAPVEANDQIETSTMGEVARATSPVKIDQRAEVRWAHDALRRGDTELAEARLRVVIKAWLEEGKP